MIMFKSILFLLFGIFVMSSTSAEPHSAHLLSAKQRGFWWNQDYLQLLTTRIDFSKVRTALDVGCGKGEWTFTIAKILPKETIITGIDKEVQWIEKIQAPTSNFIFSVADAHALPFPDQSFDLVTCQTLLMHVNDVEQVLKEMIRVLKPNGLLVLVEPNNTVNLSSSNTVQQALSLDENIDILRFHLTCQEGKNRIGEGADSIGSHLGYLLSNYQISILGTWVSEKMMMLIPPYKEEEQQALVTFWKERTAESNYYAWSKEKAKKYFLSITPNESEFNRLWEVVSKLNTEYRTQIDEKRFAGVVGGFLIMTVGRKT